MRNGQNVLVYAPRRYGKSSLVLRAAQEAIAKKTLVAYVDLMKTPTKERFAAALAKTIYADIASPSARRSRGRPSFSATCASGRRWRSTRATARFGSASRPGGARRTSTRRSSGCSRSSASSRSTASGGWSIVFDEFQEILALDKRFPNLMRAVFQAQPEVSHVYLGSKRHILERIFSDKNEPFWRSAKQLEIGMIPREVRAASSGRGSRRPGKQIDDDCARTAPRGDSRAPLRHAGARLLRLGAVARARR